MTLRGLKFCPVEVTCCVKTSADKFLVVNWSQAQDYFLTHTAHEISCAYEPAAGLQAQKVSLFTGREGSFYLISFLLHLTTTKKIDFVQHDHALVTLFVPFLSEIGQNLTGEHEFTWKNYVASGNLFTDSSSWQSFVSSDLIMFYPSFCSGSTNEIHLLSKLFCYSWLACLLCFWLRNALLAKKVIGNHGFQK